MIRLYRWFARHFICPTIFSDGHIPEPHLHETEVLIFTRRCARCHAVLGLGTWKVWRNCPPPNSTAEQVKGWEKYYDEKMQEIRQSVNRLKTP